MSSSSRPRSRVIRGGISLDARPVPFEVDLSADVATEVDPVAVEEALATGYRDGFETGHRDGYAAGLAAAREEAAALDRQRASTVNDALGALTAACNQLRSAQAVATAGTEDEIAAAAFAIAEAVVSRELAISADPGRDAIARAIALAPAGDAVVRLNPSDAATLGDLPGGRAITVVADPSVSPAGAIVEVGACSIDAQISTALGRVREALGL